MAKRSKVAKVKMQRVRVRKPTRKDAERLLARARAETREFMKDELESEHVSSDIMNLILR